MNPATSPAVNLTTNSLVCAALPQTLHNRTLPGNSNSNTGGEMDSLNLIFIVGLAIVITVLARYFSTRGRRK